MNKHHSFLYRNGLTIVLILFFLGSITGQIFTGWKEYNAELAEYGKSEVNLGAYLTTGHFIQTTFENWESEFLQMGMYVLLTIGLRQLGSSESKSLDEEEEVDRAPDSSKKDAPWPVKKGGWILTVYKHSLSLAFLLLFLISYALHAYGSLKNYNEEQVLKGDDAVGLAEFMTSSRFWFESFQNWQSEFIAVISIVVLSIYLRQQGSPESKPVDASHEETGSG
jgi:cbb3-type cytochrome oxidase subunit 3